MLVLTERPLGPPAIVMSPPQRPTSQEVFHEHAAFVWRTLRYMGVPEADIPDVCQEVFITVHRKLDSFEGRSSLRTWLYRICQRAASDRRRRAHVRRELAFEDPTEGRAEVVDLASHMEARNALRYALDQLDDAPRDVFSLYEIEGLTMKEVAEVLDCPLQTAYSRLHAARARLAAILADKENAS